MTVLSITVHGIPAPQGSKRILRAGGKPDGQPLMVESSRAVGPWRQAVKEAAVKARGGLWLPAFGPVTLDVSFHFPRPQSHYGTGRNAGKLKLSAPLYPKGPPDLSKLVRATEDALTEAGVWRDDALVVIINAQKFYGSHGFCGASISVTEMRKDLG